MLLLYLLICSAACSEQLRREKRAWIIDSFSIEEEHPGPFPYELGKIDLENKFRIHFGLYGAGVDEEPKGVLSIHKESGIVYVHKSVDYEEVQILKLGFEALKEDLSLDTKLGVEVTIRDINDNPPRFQRDVYELTISEEERQGSFLLSVLAHDRDKHGTPNSTFHYEIKSVSPTPPDAEFFINDVGRISFKGCLDYEVSDNYTVLVEAIDHGEVVQLSSSTTVLIHIQDANNHLPTISGKTGPGKVTEGETGLSPLRIHTTDRDSKNSPAWRAKYSISGDDGGHFVIQTERDTNDGILTVVKPLDFEENAETELSISVENELPYFSCKVKERISSGLWKVEITQISGGGGTRSAQTVSESETVKVIIQVEDTNDPPMFTVAVREVVVEENADIGTHVGDVTAVDPDSSHAKDFVYIIADDPDGWVKMDPDTGHITTAKILDRESPFADNGTYSVTVHAVDNGNPPMTGTATLLIHVTDQNDNLPQLTMNHVDMCVSEGPTTSAITAIDLDSDPFGGPFAFELLGDVMGKWRLDPLHGYTVNLVREIHVFAGPHTVELKISDLQGQSGIYNLSVTVCDCSVTPNCHIRRTTGSNVSYGAIVVVFAALILLLCFLLLATFISCEKVFSTVQIDNACGETLLSSNIEKPGTDCKVPNIVLIKEEKNEQKHLSNGHKGGKGKHQYCFIKVTDQSSISQDVTDTENQYLYYVNDNSMKQVYDQSSIHQDFSYLNGNSLKQRTSTVVDYGYHHCHQLQDRKYMTQSLYNLDTSYGSISDRCFISFLHQRLLSVKATEIDLGDDKPQVYVNEGDSFDTISDLEDIIPEDNFTLSKLDDLDPKFSELAAICKPLHVQDCKTNQQGPC